MICGRCGVDDDRNVIKREIEEDGDIITITYYGKCSECGEYLGEREIFECTDFYVLDEEEVKEVLKNS